MAIFHCSVGNAKSAAGADAYIEGEKRTDKSNGNYYNYESRTDVKFSETALAKNAPEEWKDSAKLWEAAAAAEQAGGRQAKKEEIALPSDWTLDKCIEVCRRRAQAITDKGHCVTWAIHDKGDGNIHAHFMRTVRAIDENGNFKKYKSKKEYLYETEKDENGNDLLDKKGNKIYKLDKDGNKIKIPQWEKVQLLDEKGEPVFNKGGKPVYAKDDKGEWIYKLDENGNKIQKLDDRNRKQWQSRMVEDLPTSGKIFVTQTRQEWETLLNEYLPENEKVSCKSLAEQGIDRLPTIHEGQGERAEERREQNELIREYNKALAEEKQITADIELLRKGEPIYDRAEQDEFAEFTKQLERLSTRAEREDNGAGGRITDEELRDFRIEIALDRAERQGEAERGTGRSTDELQQAFRQLQQADRRLEEQERTAREKARKPEHKGWSLGG